MKQETVRIKAFTNNIYDNERLIGIGLSIREEDGSYTKARATIWKFNKDNQETNAYKQFKDIEKNTQLGWIDFEGINTGDYKGKTQYSVFDILGSYVRTDEQQAERQAKLNAWAEKNSIHHPQAIKAAEQSKVEETKEQEVPWTLEW